MYDIMIKKNDAYSLLTAETRREAEVIAKKQAKLILEDPPKKWQVRILAGTNCVWEDSSKKRLLDGLYDPF